MSRPRDLYRTDAGAERIRSWCRDHLAAWPLAHQTGALPTSLGETHVVEAGAGDTVCVYLPGTNFNAATSLGILESLASRCHVLCPDLPGQPGLSSSTRPRDEEDGYARWADEVLAAVRDRHPGRRLVLAGHSRGAAVALGAAPSAVDDLVLVSPAGLIGPRIGPRLLRTAVPWMLRPTAERSRALADLMHAPGRRADADLVDWLTLVARDARTTGAPGALPASTLHRWRGRSVRVLVGEHDCFFPPARVDRAARGRLGVAAQVLAGVGHLAVEEDPERLAGLILS